MRTRAKTKKLAKASPKKGARLPVIEHIYELRRRILYVAVCVLTGSLVAYGVQQQIVAVLLRPAHGQHFIYTSPLGGINFLFGVCMDIGIVFSVPVIIYNFLKFLAPLMRAATTRFIIIGSFVSGIVALAGIAFGYFIGLPAALNFLLHQFTSAQIKPLVTIQSYLSFVSIYLLGSALMFQLPLILLFINRIKPLKPGGLLRYERHVIVAAFVIGFIMNPTPNLIDQMLVVAPIIAMYQVGILLIWVANRGKRSDAPSVQTDDVQPTSQNVLANQLAPVQELANPSAISATPHAPRVMDIINPKPVVAPVQQIAPATPQVNRRQLYINDFVVTGRTLYQPTDRSGQLRSFRPDMAE